MYERDCAGKHEFAVVEHVEKRLEQILDAISPEIPRLRRFVATSKGIKFNQISEKDLFNQA